MANIFVSYARNDRKFAEKLAKALEAEGWSVFWDRTIPTGKMWREVIGKALAEARCVVVVWSEYSIKSSWVQEEADHGRERGILIPVRIDDVKPPIGFGGLQAATLVGWDGNATSGQFQMLLADIRTILPPPTPVPDLGTAPQPEPKPSGSDWLHRAVSWRETVSVVGARVLPIIQGIANRSRTWFGGSMKRKMAIAAGVGVLVVLVTVIFYRPERPTAPIPQDTNIPGIAAQITKCNRAKGVLTIYIEFVNNKEEAYEIKLVNGGNYNQYSVVASGKRYFILLDADKVPMATPLNSYCYPQCQNLQVKIGGGGSYTFWGMYPAPPNDVKSVIFYTPFSRPFVDVPITDSR